MCYSAIMNTFTLHSPFKPAGDQPQAIKKLVEGFKKGSPRKKERGKPCQTLLGVTGSGKTFTMANVIAALQKPTLVIAHNKTLAAQLAQEYRQFFPENAVHYFVSYYDYYQPEAYLPVTDTYIEKDASINEEIDRLRHASTQALLTRKDVIIVASVSCIYGLGSPEEYERENLKLSVGTKLSRSELLQHLVRIHFERTSADLKPGSFRARGDTVEIMPTGGTHTLSIRIKGGAVAGISAIDPVSRRILREEKNVFIFPAKHFITSKAAREAAIKSIQLELAERLKEFEKAGKLLEAERLKRRTTYDVAMIREVGYCSGIENYSRHLSGRATGTPPDTLLSYFGKDFLAIIDESHVSIPQIAGMYAGDKSRKETLIEHGFRLPSARDNRPLTFAEFEERIGPLVCTSATPGGYEREHSTQIVEQVIRPTGLIDPELTVRPIREEGSYQGQIQDLIAEVEKTVQKGDRALVTTLTKKMAESLSEYLKERGISARYLHSDVKTLERIQLLTEFRRGSEGGGFDCLVGVNLLREGLDLPEVSFIGILDADKEGFLRSQTSLIQTIGRAARNVTGRVILYADTLTGSMERAINETNRRRALQRAYNKEHDITPVTITKGIKDITENLESLHEKTVREELALDRKVFGKDKKNLIREKVRAMNAAVKELDFETAAILRDEIRALGVN